MILSPARHVLHALLSTGHCAKDENDTKVQERIAMILTDEEVTIEVASHHTEPLRSKQLVAAARSGSDAAFAELMELYAKRVYRKLLMITKNREDAEDAFQDTFLRAYRALHAFEERASFYTWVTTIAINSALMILRKRRARPELLFDLQPHDRCEAFFAEPKDPSPNPEEVCDLRQCQAKAWRAIDRASASRLR